MYYDAALFLFLAATVVSVFAFLSIAVWVTTPSQERQLRERTALLKTLAEQPGENARQILEMLRSENEVRTERKRHQERRSLLLGGFVVMAAGIGLGATLLTVTTSGIWTISLIPLLIGCVLAGAGLLTGRRAGAGGRTTTTTLMV